MSGERLYAAMKTIAKRATPSEDLADLIYGVVKSVSPMRIEVENKYVIEAAQILLSPFCHRKTVTQELQGSGVTTLELWRGLAAGDRVVMLRHGGGQAFYVLHRMGELS